MRQFFYPNSIVVIGVSERPDNLARNILANLIAFGYQGDLYAVGRSRGEAHGIPIATSLDDIPDSLDLAVILTPATTVPDLMDACGRKGIQRVVIESGGFSEFSEEGQLLEERILKIARQWSIRFVGPNCISILNLEAGVCLPFVPLSPETVRLGPVSVLSQSGGVSVTYLDQFSAAGVGCNKVVSMGNKADLDESDYLAYLLEDPGTEVICLYLESIGDGQQLIELAQSSDKHIVVHKSNRGQASQQIAFSHTAALLNDDRIVNGAFRQAGILRVDGFRDAAAVSQALSLPPVRGDRLVVISRSGGHAVIAADAAEEHGFRLASIPDSFSRKVREFFRADVIALTNPIDLGVIFDFDLYAQIVEECLRTLAPDAVVLINTYSLHEAEKARQLIHRVEDIVRETELPVALCLYSAADEVQVIQREVGLPLFTEIAEAVKGLAVSRDRHRWLATRRMRSQQTIPREKTPQVSVEEGVLTMDQALALCQKYHIPVADWETATSAEEAAQAAERLGYPVAVKILSAQLSHKSDVGGVALSLENASDLRQEAQRMLNMLQEIETNPSDAKLLVQRMVNPGVEVILGGKQDPSFGPVVMFGMGGIFVETLDDVSFRIAPLTRLDAEEMIEEVRGSRIFQGARGTPPSDRDSLIEALLSLSRMLVDNAHIEEIDINPLLVLQDGVSALDARAVVK
jgi:acetyltransferase